MKQKKPKSSRSQANGNEFHDFELYLYKIINMKHPHQPNGNFQIACTIRISEPIVVDSII